MTYGLRPSKATCSEDDWDANTNTCQGADGIIESHDFKQDMGLFVRPPVMGRVKVCVGPKTDTCKFVAIKKDKPSMHMIPQLGQLRFLPFKNGMFESNSMELVLKKSGYIEKFAYKETKSVASEAASALNEMVDQFKTFKEEQETKLEEALEKQHAATEAARAEEIALLAHDIDKLNKEQELYKLQNPESPEEESVELQTMMDETIVLDAKIALITAQQTLLELEQGVPE